MSSDDWYRNKEWDSAIESRFFAKLARAKRKPFYLETQAGDLVETHPAAALALLEQYFALGGQDALAFLHQARARLKLGQTQAALESLQSALRRERENPYVLTQAWSDYCLLVATQRMDALYADTLDVLREVERNRAGRFLPVDQFLWYASQALIAAAQGGRELAAEYAAKALAAAAVENTGLRYHPTFGLVGSKYQQIKSELERLCSR